VRYGTRRSDGIQCSNSRTIPPEYRSLQTTILFFSVSFAVGGGVTPKTAGRRGRRMHKGEDAGEGLLRLADEIGGILKVTFSLAVPHPGDRHRNFWSEEASCRDEKHGEQNGDKDYGLRAGQAPGNTEIHAGGENVEEKHREKDGHDQPEHCLKNDQEQAGRRNDADPDKRASGQIAMHRASLVMMGRMGDRLAQAGGQDAGELKRDAGSDGRMGFQKGIEFGTEEGNDQRILNRAGLRGADALIQ
jgi:hypothetical protein